MRHLALLRQFLFETPADQGQAPPPAEPAAVAPPTPPPAEPAAVTPPSDAPWTADLATYFEDEAARANADRYMREKHQPYVTQLQQQVADLSPARALYDDLVANPDSTFAEIAAELYAGDPRAEQIAAILAAPNAPAATTPAEPAAAPPAIEDPVLAQMREDYQNRKQQEAYDAELERVKASNPDITIHDTLFAPHVVTASGDFDKALETYKQWDAQARQTYGPPPVEPAPGDPPPATLGSDGTGGTAPPIAPKYETLDDALDATMDDMRAARGAPTPVGSV